MKMKHLLVSLGMLMLLASYLGCATPLTTREKSAAIGALGGAAAGGIIGGAFNHPAAGAAIGTGLGLGVVALIGD